MFYVFGSCFWTLAVILDSDFFCLLHEKLCTEKVCTNWVFQNGVHLKCRVGSGENKMCQTDPRKKPNRQTDVVTGDETFISFCGVLSKQKIKLWCGSIKLWTGPVVHLKNSCSTLREFEPTTFQFALIIITNAFLMHWIPLWLYMCEAESTMHETLQQYTT